MKDHDASRIARVNCRGLTFQRTRARARALYSGEARTRPTRIRSQDFDFPKSRDFDVEDSHDATGILACTPKTRRRNSANNGAFECAAALNAVAALVLLIPSAYPRFPCNHSCPISRPSDAALHKCNGFIVMQIRPLYERYILTACVRSIAEKIPLTRAAVAAQIRVGAHLTSR